MRFRGAARRGELTCLPERTKFIYAFACGATLYKACAEGELSIRTYRRWYEAGNIQADLRLTVTPPTSLTNMNENRY